MVLTPASGSTLAWTDRPQHVKSTVTFNEKSLVRKFCDFGVHNVNSDSDNAVIFPDATIVHFISQFNAADGQTKQIGPFWHVRNADGKLTVIQNDVSGQPREPRTWSCRTERRA
jgi:bifunctional N-acetylglucosamine-1-phosphate-uridyltransferase/glucosamine-1-phosphate-acetyltransferase GlmU-like protein